MKEATVSIDPVAYAVTTEPAANGESARSAQEHPGSLAFRVDARSLAGMLKEAIVWPLSGNHQGWRMLSDEGPYLNGTDYGPFPLGFFAAGLQLCFLEQLARCAQEEGIAIDSLETVQDTWYAMKGSALRGDITGSAMPVDLLVKLRARSSPERLAELICRAEQRSPAHALMRDARVNTFACRLNGAAVPLDRVAPSAAQDVCDPAGSFGQMDPDPAVRSPQPLIARTYQAKKEYGVPWSAGSSLQAEQSRTLQVHGKAQLLENGLLESEVQVLSPSGSRFRLVSEVEPPRGQARVAPPALAYLSAGLAFCFMTQLSRYTHIVKYPIRSYRVAQFTRFHRAAPNGSQAGAATAGPADTHLFLDGDISGDAAAGSLRMAEQMCFLHAAMRGSHPTRLAAEVNRMPGAAEMPWPFGCEDAPR